MADYFKAVNLYKHYETNEGTLDVLGGIDLYVKPQEFVCIMGNSGCGKSTLIRILEGVEKPDDGLVTLGKEILSSSPSKARQKKFGIVYQSDNLLEWLSVYKNVELPLSTFKMKDGKEKDKEKIMDVLTTVGLENFSDCLPRELSGGMRQRCAIARALVTEPDILMLDQPFGALDAITRKMLNYELLKIQNQMKKTCVMITNSVNEALLLGQRILIMSNSPAKIVKEIKVPFTYEERMNQLSLNKTYLEMRKELNDIVRNL